MGRKHTKCKYNKSHKRKKHRRRSRNKKSYKQRGGSGVPALVGGAWTPEPSTWPGQNNADSGRGIVGGNHLPYNKEAGVGGKCISSSSRLAPGQKGGGRKHSRRKHSKRKHIQKGGGGNILIDNMVGGYRDIVHGLESINTNFQGLSKSTNISPAPYEQNSLQV